MSRFGLEKPSLAMLEKDDENSSGTHIDKGWLTGYNVLVMITV